MRWQVTDSFAVAWQGDATNGAATVERSLDKRRHGNGEDCLVCGTMFRIGMVSRGMARSRFATAKNSEVKQGLAKQR